MNRQVVVAGTLSVAVLFVLTELFSTSTSFAVYGVLYGISCGVLRASRRGARWGKATRGNATQKSEK